MQSSLFAYQRNSHKSLPMAGERKWRWRLRQGRGVEVGGGRSWKQGVKKRVRVSRLVYGRGEDKGWFMEGGKIRL